MTGPVARSPHDRRRTGTPRPDTLLAVDDPWAAIAAERLALADVCETLTPEQWETRSLCGEWTVKQVAIHVMIGPTVGMDEVLTVFLKARGNLERANRLFVERRSTMSTGLAIEMMREYADSRFTPPTMDWHAPLTDVMVHRLDITVPAGVSEDPTLDRPVGHWLPVLDFLTGPKARRGFVRKGRPDLTLIASDTDWTHGAGPAITGPAAALALTLSGRPALLDRLDGPGVPALRDWLAA